MVAELCLSLAGVHHPCGYLSALLSGVKADGIWDLRLGRHSFPVELDRSAVL